MRIVVECRACGHEREVKRRAVVTGSWKRQVCPVCNHGPDGLLPVACDCGHISVEFPDAVLAGAVTCPACEAAADD